MITGSEAVITVTFSSYLVSTTTGKGQMDIFRLRYKDAPKENGGSELKQKHVREESLCMFCWQLLSLAVVSWQLL